MGTMINHDPKINNGASKIAPSIPNLPSELPNKNKPTTKIMNERNMISPLFLYLLIIL